MTDENQCLLEDFSNSDVDGTSLISKSGLSPNIPVSDESKGEEPEITESLSLQRDGIHLTTNSETLIHILKGNIGTGMHAMPFALKNAGLALGSAGIVILGMISTHCMLLLVDCAHHICKKYKLTSIDFSGTGELSFQSQGWTTTGVIIRKVITVFLVVTQIGFCCVYFVYVAVNIKQVLDSWLPNHTMSIHGYMATLLVPFTLIVFIKDLKRLAPISMVANIMILISVGILLKYLLTELPPISEAKLIGPPALLPIYFGTVVYAFEGIGVILPIENKMKHPKDFVGWNGVLSTAMGIAIILYFSIGFFGYIKYGEFVEGSITLNLPSGDWLADSVKILMALGIFFSYPIQFYVCFEIIWQMLADKLPDNRFIDFEYFSRFLLVLFTFLMAVMIPNIGLFISLVGAASSSALCFIIPPIIHTITFWPEMGILKWMLFKNLAISAFGLLGSVTGTYVSVKAIFDYYSH